MNSIRRTPDLKRPFGPPDPVPDRVGQHVEFAGMPIAFLSRRRHFHGLLAPPGLHATSSIGPFTGGAASIPAGHGRLPGRQGPGGTRRRRPGEARPLVRGPRTLRRADQAPDARHAARPVQRRRAGLARAGRVPGQVESSRRGRQAGRRGSGAEGGPPGIPGTPGQDARPGRGPLEARPLVRSERAQAAGRRPPPPGGRPRPAARRGVEAAGLQEAKRAVGEARRRRGREGRARGPDSREQDVETAAREVAGCPLRPGQVPAGRGGGSPRPGERPPRRAHGLDGLRPGRRVPPASRREAPRPDRRPGCLARAGADGGLQPLGRHPPGVQGNPPPPRPARLRRAPDRLAPRAGEVPGQAGRRARVAGRALRRGQGCQRPPALRPPRAADPPARRPARHRRLRHAHRHPRPGLILDPADARRRSVPLGRPQPGRPQSRFAGPERGGPACRPEQAARPDGRSQCRQWDPDSPG